ncbi:hypothetical protein RclHR1_09050004 [Rhizophagus clarus]|uniref:Uncharacterized protein n=1 Tax=Rhizophagus clarus TaxID=94130 RepID=A0A2Z6S331_9GLOM|nr:hypothetical protein RclHR1_09050004 [Rhizophagus clarus]GES95949.1 hypothetical protein GLOIN_2v1543548 [Rhizophagus clarus]
MKIKQAVRETMEQAGFDLGYWNEVKDINLLTYLNYCKDKAHTKLDKSKVYKDYVDALEYIKSNYEIGSNKNNKVTDALEAFHDDAESSMVKRFWERYDDNDDDDDDDNHATTSTQQGKSLNVNYNKHPKLKNYCRKLRELLNQNSEQLSQQGRHACNMLEWNIVDYEIFSKIIIPGKIPELPNISLLSLNLKNTLAALKRKDQRFDPLIKIMQSLQEKNKISDNSEWFGKLYQWSYQLYSSTKYYDINITTVIRAISAVFLYIPPSPHIDEPENHIKMELWAKIFSAVFSLNYDTKLAPIWEFTHLISGQGDKGYSISDFAAVVVDQDEGQYPFFLAEFASENAATHKDKIVVVSEAAYELGRILVTVKNLNEWEVNEIRFHVATVGGTTINLSTITPIFNEECSALIYVYRNEHTFNLRHSNSNMESNVLEALRLITYLREIVCADGIRIKTILNRNYKVRDTVSNLRNALPNLPLTPEKSRVSKGTYTPPPHRVNYIFQNLD